MMRLKKDCLDEYTLKKRREGIIEKEKKKKEKNVENIMEKEKEEKRERMWTT